MRRNAEDFKTGLISEDLIAKDPLTLAHEALGWSNEEIEIEDYISTNVEIPKNKYIRGHNIEVNPVLVSADKETLLKKLNLDQVDSDSLKGTQNFKIPGRKLQFKVVLMNGVKELWHFENFKIQGNFENEFERDEYYLPVTFTAAKDGFARQYYTFDIINDQSTLSTTTIKLNVPTGEYAYINWGDGNYDIITGDGTLQSITHDYASTGEYTINVQGYAKNITGIDISSQSFLTGELGAMHGLNNDMATINIYGTGFHYTSTPLPDMKDADIDIKDNNLSSNEVDNFLIDLDEASSDSATGTLDISGNNAARTGKSDAAKSSLINKGWTITVNE